jgi:type II secretory pathway pseudopilin PulG
MLRPTSVVSSPISGGGFTIIELVVTIGVLTILVGIAFGTIMGVQSRAQDAERASDVSVIAQTLERYYKTQASATGATYPANSIGASGIAALIEDNDAYIAPGQTSNSIVIATSNSAQTPTINQYIYQPLNLDGTLCTSTPCVRYKLFYTLEATNTTVVVNSMRQQ